MRNKIAVIIVTAGLISNTIGYSIVKAAPAVTTTITSNDSSSVAQNSTDSLEDQLTSLDNEISKNLVELNNQNQKIAGIEKQITLNEKGVAKLSEKFKTTEALSSERMRAMYINGDSNAYLRAILDSKNLSDVINTTMVIKDIIKFDENTLKTIKNEQTELNKKKLNLSKEKEDAVKLRDAISKKVVLLNSQKESSQQLLDKLPKQSLSSKDANEYFLTSLSRGGFSSNNDIVNYSFNFLGIPYVWGGTSPSGFDCSGLTQYVYAHFGISIPRIAEDQQNCGTPVLSREDLHPGDLVFWGNPAHHVGMYIGDGKYIQAPHTGDYVKISELGEYTSAERIK